MHKFISVNLQTSLQTVATENIYESASPYQCPSQDEAGLYEQISSYHINVISSKDIK